MEFVYPQFLYALVAVVIPVIIHLFNFRRFKKIAFSNIAFLKEVEQQTRSKNRLKHVLILLSRMFFIATLVLAFAQPFIPAKQSLSKNRTDVVTIYTDNSFSMEAQSEDGVLLDVARQFGYDILEALPAQTSYFFVSNDPQSSGNRMAGKNQVKTELGELSISPKSAALSDIVARQNTFLRDEGYNRFTSFIISDFQKNTADLEQIHFDSNGHYIFIPVEAARQPNVSVDSVWFDLPFHRLNQPEILHVRFRNHSDDYVGRLPVTLEINGETRAVGSVDIDARTTVDTTFSFTPVKEGVQKGSVTIDDTPVRFDNTYYFSYMVRPSIDVIEIRGRSTSGDIELAFSTEPYFQYTKISSGQIDFARLSGRKLIIINGLSEISSGLSDALANFVRAGGTLLVFPGINSDIGSYNRFLANCSDAKLLPYDTTSTRVSAIAYEHPVYKTVFTEKNRRQNLPVVNGRFPQSGNGTWLLKTIDGSTVLSELNCKRGKIYLSSIPADERAGNFVVHGLFLPTLFMIGFQSVNDPMNLQTIGREKPVELPGNLTENEELIHIVNSETHTDIIPELYKTGLSSYIKLHGTIERAGNYDITVDGKVIGGLSFNYDRTESDLSCLSIDQLEHFIDDNGYNNVTIIKSDLSEFKTDLHLMSSGKPLWRWFLMTALLFLAIEILLIRLIKPSGL